MTSAPIVAMVLAKENAVQQWRELIGPTNSSVAKETNPDRFVFSFFIKIYFLFVFELVFEHCMEPMNRRMQYTEVIVHSVLNEKFDSSFQIVSKQYEIYDYRLVYFKVLWNQFLLDNRQKIILNKMLTKH